MNIYLTKSIMTIIATISLVGVIGDCGANNSTTTLDPIIVTPPGGAPSGPGGGGSGGGGGGGDGGGSDGGGGGGGYGGDDDEPLPCAFLALMKPPNCPNPIPAPNGYSYANDQFAPSSGLRKAISWIDNNAGAVDSARYVAIQSLNSHTTSIRALSTPLDQVNNMLLESWKTVCETQRADPQDEFARGFGGVSATNAERTCYEALDKLSAEAGNLNFQSYFIQQLQLIGIDLNDLGVPNTLINLFSPENSLTKKFETVTADATCAKWWGDVEANQCSF